MVPIPILGQRLHSINGAAAQQPDTVKVSLHSADPNIINNQYNTTALKIVSDIIHVHHLIQF